MKKDKKLTLNKQTVSKLTENGKVKGGLTPVTIVTYLASCLGGTCRDCGGGGATENTCQTCGTRCGTCGFCSRGHCD